MAAPLKLVPASQVVFGTDYPYVPVDTQAAALGRLGLSGSDIQAIESGNAKNLIPRLRA